ncbi:hypothetical protein TNCT_454471 [Trichonephila clavata]|uniref:Uncharacterized protein n=1 Tax=Trichonephila clavata TaxID=2740835 RepID=A0A8X6FY37_TRICU|nr:hypothetical protein TNCT_454471 [Trichonephila clavata]
MITEGYQHKIFLSPQIRIYHSPYLFRNVCIKRPTPYKCLIFKIERRWIDTVSQYPLAYEVCAWGYPHEKIILNATMGSFLVSNLNPRRGGGTNHRKGRDSETAPTVDRDLTLSDGISGPSFSPITTSVEAIKWQDKKDVCMTSAVRTAEMIEFEDKKKEKKLKPQK